MAKFDYKSCDVCDCKAYYDAHVNYEESEVKVLCSECKNKYLFELAIKQDT